MEGDPTFIAALTEAVEQRNRFIEHTVLPGLKEQFVVFHASLQSMMSIMVRKGLIQEDPYKTEQKVSDVVIPDDNEFPDAEQVVVIGIRLSQLDNVLEYTANYVDFSLRALGFTELRRLSDLARYVAWDDLKINSPKPTTRAIASLMGKMKAGSDSLAAGIINSAMKALSDGCLQIVDQLKQVREFQRERYKLDLRTTVFPTVEDSGSLKADDPESIRKVKAAFSGSGMSGPFVPELVSEVIAEETGASAAGLREETLRKLQTKVESRSKKKSAPVALKQLLIDSIRSIASSSRALEEALERLRENAAVIQNRRRGIGARLREWFERLMNRKSPAATYELEFMDEATGTRHKESVELDGFLEKLHKKGQAYGGILAKSGSLWAKIEKASEDQLYKFVNQELGALHLIHRRALAFDNYFKSQSTTNEKKRLRGIKIELTTIRNSIAKTSQLKHEYVSRREEQEQLRKLGIDSGRS